MIKKLWRIWVNRNPFKKNNDLNAFDARIRIDSDKLSETEKMDKGFNGKTYTINGIESDF